MFISDKRKDNSQIDILGMALRKVKVGLFAQVSPELQKCGILVSRIPDISWRKSGHFQIVAANFTIFGIKRLHHCYIRTQFKSKWEKLRSKHAFIQFYVSYYGKDQQIQDPDIFPFKIRIPDEKSLFATLHSLSQSVTHVCSN